MANTLGSAGVLQVVPPAQLEQQLQQQARDKAANAAASQPGPTDNEALAGFVRGQWEIFRNHRNTVSGWSERLLRALRTFNGQYDATKLNEIRKYGGSEVYARLIAQKCRAASSLLRDIYLGQDRPWAIRPTTNPTIPPEILNNIGELMMQEHQMVMKQTGQPPPKDAEEERQKALMEGAIDAAKKKAGEQAKDSEDKIEDLLREGGFYHALAEFIVDLPVFPFAVMKGPVVKIMPKVTWPKGGGQPTVQHTPRLTWVRVSPFDVWWTPGAGDIEQADVIEKLRFTRAEINDLLDLPGYNQESIRAVLDEYGTGGLYDNWDTTDAERAVLESRENPAWNRSRLITVMEYNGNVQGRMLQEYGLAVPDELRDYAVQVWVCGRHVLKAHLMPSPRQRHPYFVTSFEKVPGTPVGNGLSDMLEDLQEAANATLRSLINNMSIASGPQCVVNDDRLAADENGEELYPWKRWHVRNDPVGNNAQQPVEFFMPTSNAQQLIGVFNEFEKIADDVSALPKYVGGQGGGGGAGRTASGLAMLMGNASKLLQTVSANIDRDVVEPLMLQLADLIMLTDSSGLLTGEEKISVQGVNVAIQRETIRQRQIEFLSATANPLDQQIVGMKGRAAILRNVSKTIGMDGEQIVPPEQQIEQMEQANKQKAAQGGDMMQVVQQGVQKGVAAGVARISTELTAGILAQKAQMPEGAPAHLGTLPAGNQPDAAAQAQGMQQGPRAGGGMAPVTKLVGMQPGPKAMPISPGVG